MKLASVVLMAIGAVALATAAFGTPPVSAPADRSVDTSAAIPGLEGPVSRMQRRADDTGSPDIFAPSLDQAFKQSGLQGRLESSRGAASASPLEINVVFHVLSGPRSEGDLSDALLQEQMSVLNDAYRSAGFHFNLSEVHRYPGSPFFSGGCFPTTEEGLRMKSELAIDPARFVNIYTCRLDLPYIAGYGTLPNEYPEADPRHGVVVDYGAFPGSPAPLSLGHTLVHELGHYLGLLHTFQGGCAEPGDDVSDTHAEAGPAYGCLIGRDSCPQEGADPISNFMDYSDDTCTDNFTALQGARMQTLVAIYRPGLARPVASVALPAPALSRQGLALLGLSLSLIVLLARSFRRRL